MNPCPMSPLKTGQIDVLLTGKGKIHQLISKYTRIKHGKKGFLPANIFLHHCHHEEFFHSYG